MYYKIRHMSRIRAVSTHLKVFHINYNSTFEALFLTSKCTQSHFLWTQTVAPHPGFSLAAQRRFRSAYADYSSQIAPNREYFTIHLIQDLIQYFYNKSEIYGTHGTMKRPIPPGWSVDYSAPSHLAVATCICTLSNVERWNATWSLIINKCIFY